MKWNRKSTLRLIYSALFLALGLVLPFVTGQIPQIGKMLLPMHLPVLLCGAFCGGIWGMTVGLVTPFARSLLFGQPLFLKAFSMSFELLTYGFVFGILCKRLPKKMFSSYLALLIAQVLGRVVYAAVQFTLMGFGMTEFSFTYLWSGTILEALPGIVLQWVVVPPLVYFLQFKKEN